MPFESMFPRYNKFTERSQSSSRVRCIARKIHSSPRYEVGTGLGNFLLFLLLFRFCEADLVIEVGSSGLCLNRHEIFVVAKIFSIMNRVNSLQAPAAHFRHILLHHWTGIIHLPASFL